MRLHLKLLGAFEGRLPSGSVARLRTKKARALIVYLGLRPGQFHSRTRLIALFWGDKGEAAARNSLRQTLSTIKKVLASVEPPCLLVNGETVALNPHALEIDIATFERLVAEGTPEALEQALEIYRGDLVEGLDLKEEAFEDWLAMERDRFRELAIQAFLKLLDHQINIGAADQAIRTGVRLLALDPLQESAHRALMEVYDKLGRRASALKQYESCAEALRRELGVEPEAETEQLYQNILQQRSTPRLRTSASGRGEEARASPVYQALVHSETPLIARGLELKRLLACLDRAMDGRGHTVAVTGEAGIGKSRLIQEIAAAGLAHEMVVLVGHSYESERILPFALWVDAFRNSLLRNWTELLEDFNPIWRTELGQILPELRSGVAPQTAQDLNYLRLFEAVTQLVRHLAARKPTLLILEDVHWADEMSLRLISFVGRRIHDSYSLVVATAREEDLAAASSLQQALDELNREGRLALISLSPLSQVEAQDFVRALVGNSGASTETMDQKIWALSEGNPFVVYETVRAIEEGKMPELGDRLSLPERVQEVISGRLGRLSPMSRTLAEVAAVIGRPFEFPVLQRAAALSEAETSSALEELVQRRILYGREETFDFTHERIRDVTYDQILPPRRKALHGSVAQTLEAFHRQNLQPYFAVLGTHYLEAGVWVEALSFLTRAGSLAAAHAAHREAVACYQRALKALELLPESRDAIEQAIDLRFKLRNSLLPLGEHDEILRLVQEAQTLSEKLDDSRRLGWALSYFAREFWFRGDPDQAMQTAERSLAIAERLSDVGLRLIANVRRGQTQHALGRYPQAIATLRKTLTSIESDLIREQYGMAAPPAVIARTWLIWSLAEHGEFQEGLRWAEEGLRIAEEVDQPYTIVSACFGLGIIHLFRGDLGDAVAALERGVSLCQVREVPVFFPWIAATLGFAQVLLGRPGEGLPLLEQSIRPLPTSAIQWPFPFLWASWAYRLVGNGEKAEATAQKALEIARVRKESAQQAWAHLILGNIHSAVSRAEPGIAEAHYQQSLILAKKLEMKPLEAHVRAGLGTLQGRRGHHAQACEELSQAKALFHGMGMAFWLKQTGQNLEATS